ncbi:MAG TPA: glycosyltransferase [Candidatus Polarisedimenticolia bacterium]|nr:glycosyltransferase [Candidatus Polarisedimenticolia bacterium]
MSTPALSIVVPTYNRRELLSRTLPALLQRAREEGPAEVIVVVDGSADGTLEILAGYVHDPGLQVIFQENRGLAAARNRGTAAAAAEAVLFLDDDMLLDEGALAQHRAAHAPEGERVVFGSLGLAPGPRRSFLKEGVEVWGEQVRERLSAPGYRFRFDDCHFGHASVSRSLLRSRGGFDETYVKFGNEDYDLGWRLIQASAEMRFLPEAVARQIYDKDMPRWLRDCQCVGEADQVLAAKHPLLRSHLRLSALPEHPLRRLARRSGLSAADPLAPLWALLESSLSRLERRGARGRWLGMAQSLVGERRYWMGVRSRSGEMPSVASSRQARSRSVA